MDVIKVKLERGAIRKQLLKGAEVSAVCEAQAKEIRHRAAPDGYGQDRYMGRNRVNYSVFPVTTEATRDTMKNNTLLKAVGGLNRAG